MKLKTKCQWECRHIDGNDMEQSESSLRRGGQTWRRVRALSGEGRDMEVSESSLRRE
jgi:hypothetical protein